VLLRAVVIKKIVLLIAQTNSPAKMAAAVGKFGLLPMGAYLDMPFATPHPSGLFPKGAHGRAPRLLRRFLPPDLSDILPEPERKLTAKKDAGGEGTGPLQQLLQVAVGDDEQDNTEHVDETDIEEGVESLAGLSGNQPIYGQPMPAGTTTVPPPVPPARPTTPTGRPPPPSEGSENKGSVDPATKRKRGLEEIAEASGLRACWKNATSPKRDDVTQVGRRHPSGTASPKREGTSSDVPERAQARRRASRSGEDTLTAPHPIVNNPRQLTALARKQKDSSDSPLFVIEAVIGMRTNNRRSGLR
jgi:hypothetical protein